MHQVLLVAPILLPIMAAAIILASAASPERAARIVTRALALNVAAATLLLVIVVEGGPFGNELLTAGRATAVLVLLTAGVGATVASYAGRALAGDPRQKHWHTWTTVLVAATSTTALAGSGPILITGWVMTTVSVVALVGHHSHWIETRRARRRVAAALLVGNGALIAGLALAALTVGNIDFRRPEVSGADLSSQGWPLTVVAVLLVVAAISRSALVPLHRWLPSTLAAPTPVSALLHAGVVNGAGVLLIKTAPITGASAWAMGILLAAGAATAILATGVMIVRADVKGKLAWSTAGQMGFMTVQLAVGAFGAAIFHIVGHAMYKASLFLGSGSAVQAMTVKRRVPAARVATRSRRLTALPPLALGAVATVAAISVLEPSGPAAANLLIGLFGWAMVAQLVTGWLRSVDDTGPAVLTALGAALLVPWAYVGGAAAFKRLVDTSTIAGADKVIGWVPLTALLAGVALTAAAVAWLPGSAGQSLRRVLTARLIGLGTPAVSERMSAQVPSRPSLRLVSRGGTDTASDLDESPSDLTWRSTA